MKRSSERGAAVAEYALMVAMVLGLVVAAVFSFGGDIIVTIGRGSEALGGEALSAPSMQGRAMTAEQSAARALSQPLPTGEDLGASGGSTTSALTSGGGNGG